MRVFFYHLESVSEKYEKWKSGEFPGHLLYGLTHLDRYGIACSFYGKDFNYSMRRWKLMLYNLYHLLIRQDYDLLYAVTHRGLELIILLRALGLYRKPIVIWHHTAVVNPSGWLRGRLSRLFYKGIDKMFFFSEELIARSLTSGKVKRENAFLIHWGGDLNFYSRLRNSRAICPERFISTGVENRDFVTLVKAFNETGASLAIYTRPYWGRDYLAEVKKNTTLGKQIDFNVVDRTVPEMAELVASSYCVVISCLDFPYTVGLTTLVEAMALGLPVITTDNPTFEMDIEKEGAGLKVAYADVEGWKRAIEYMRSHPEEARQMGQRARLLAESRYNLEILSKEVAKVLLSFKG